MKSKGQKKNVKKLVFGDFILKRALPNYQKIYHIIFFGLNSAIKSRSLQLECCDIQPFPTKLLCQFEIKRILKRTTYGKKKKIFKICID